MTGSAFLFTTSPAQAHRRSSYQRAAELEKRNIGILRGDLQSREFVGGRAVVLQKQEALKLIRADRG
jgi:hypothetical protein